MGYELIVAVPATVSVASRVSIVPPRGEVIVFPIRRKRKPGSGCGCGYGHGHGHGRRDLLESPMKIKKIYVFCKSNLTFDEAIEMINIAITKISSRGQIVIPSEMRDNFSTGEKLVIIKSGEQLILKKVSDLGGNFEEDLAFSRRTEEAWQSYERGEFVSRSADKFLEELEEC